LFGLFFLFASDGLVVGLFVRLNLHSALIRYSIAYDVMRW
jgi:hypothetical protein